MTCTQIHLVRFFGDALITGEPHKQLWFAPLVSQAAFLREAETRYSLFPCAVFLINEDLNRSG